MSTPTPPADFKSWLDYLVATSDLREAYPGRKNDENEAPSQADIRAAAQRELDYLEHKAHLPGFRMLDNWRVALSKLLGRSCEEIVEDGLLPSDFSDAGVHVQFRDGSNLTFQRAFYVGETPADEAIHRVAVFTEHCGYHEFWIGLHDRIQKISPTTKADQNSKWSNDIRQAQAEAAQGLVVPYMFGPISAEDLAWDTMAPVGREFGSPDYDQLMDKDAKKFAADLSRWIQQCTSAKAPLLEDDDISDARNVQLALGELGQKVSVEVAAAVWRHYSQSVAATWMSGAQTVQSAARILYLHCPKEDENFRT